MSWIDEFMLYTEQLPSPRLFRKWAAITAVAGALERKVWVRPYPNKVTYPNIYVALVGPPGTGKTVVTSEVWTLWDALTNGTVSGHHVAPSSVSKASLIDALAKAERKIIRPMDNPSVISFNSLQIACDELGVLIPAYENDFMNVLTAIYDNNPYSETRRTRDLNIQIRAPQLNIIAGTTPSYLNAIMPEGAWEQGFISRMFLIYSGDTHQPELFSEGVDNTAKHKRLEAGLTKISKLYGMMKFTPEAAAAIKSWVANRCQPAPTHPRLNNYNTRRILHMLKLCMISSAASSEDLTITLEHYVEAHDWLVEAEGVMEDIFKSMRSGGDSRIIEECWHFAYTVWMKDKKPIPEFRLITFLQERAPAHAIPRILEVMERGRILEKKFMGGVGNVYEPKPPKS